MGNISSNSKGMYKGKSHAEGGIPVVVDGNTNVEIEGNEYHLCRDAMSSAKIYSFKNKSNKEILDSIYSSEGCKFVQGIANSGDFIVCKLVVLDDDKRTISGTVKSIIDTMQSEKSCNVSEGGSKMEKGGGVKSEWLIDDKEATLEDFIEIYQRQQSNRFAGMFDFKPKKVEYFGDDESSIRRLKDYNRIASIYGRNGEFKESYMKAIIRKAFNDFSFVKFGNAFRKHIDTSFKAKGHEVNNNKWSEVASYIIGDDAYDISSQNDFINFAKELGIKIPEKQIVENESDKMEKGGYVAISQFNRNINNELKNYIDEDEEVSFEYKRERVKLVYAKKFYEKNNITPLAEPDLEISSFLTQWVSYNDSNYQISFHYNFEIDSIKLEKVKATLYSEDWDEIKTFADGGNIPNSNKECLSYIETNKKNILSNGYCHYFRSLPILEDVYAHNVNEPSYLNDLQFLLITYNSVNSLFLRNEIKKLLGCSNGLAKTIVSKHLKSAKKIDESTFETYKDERIIIANRDEIVCQNIVEQMEKGGGIETLLAPNGKPSNLTPEQYKLVRTPAFKKWFGDWENDAENSSKVVDENGEPLVMYHGSRTTNENNVFYTFEIGNGAYDEGIYFTSDKKEAKGFSYKTGFIYDCFLNIKNPFVETYYRKYAKTKIENNDGIIVKDLNLVGWGICFNPNQIKLADGSNTTFDGNNNDIRYKDGGSIDEHKETYEKWKSLVNMSKSELKEFYDSQEGKDAGLSDKESNDLGISNGRESARWIMRMKDTPVSDWTPKMWEWANKQISFISRMSGNKGSLYDDNGNKTRKHTSLLIWGHNPEKMSNGGEVGDKQEIIKKKLLSTFDYLPSNLEFLGKGLNGYAFIFDIKNELYVAKYSTSITEFWLTEMAFVSKPPHVVTIKDVKKISDNYEYGIIHKYTDNEGVPNESAWNVAIGINTKEHLQGEKSVSPKEKEQTKKLAVRLTREVQDYFGIESIDTTQPNWGYEDGKLVLFDLDGDVKKWQYEEWMEKYSKYNPKKMGRGGEVQGIKDFKNVKIINDYYPKNIIAYVSPKELLDRHLKDEPSYSILIDKNKIGNRVETAKKYLENYLNNPKLINPKTNQRTEYQATFEPSIVSIYNGKFGFTDGRHRVLSAHLLGLEYVPISIPKNQIDLFRHNFSSFMVSSDNNNPKKMGNGGEIKDLILSKKIELNFYRTFPDHALEYGIKAKNPLYLKNFHVTKSERLKGIGKKMLKYLDDYAIENGNDVIFGYINQKATFSKNKETYLNDTQLIKNWLHDNGYAVNDDDNNFHKVVGAKMKQGGNVITYRNKFNKKYGFELNESHSIEEIAKLTSLKLSALQDIYNKGIGAYKTNPESVRPIVKSKEQWAMARVYSAVMGGKASKVDANELERGKMADGGSVKTDRSGNYIGDGNYHTNYEVIDFDEYPQIYSNVSKSETTESVYVTYTNSINNKSITVRFSDHENNAVKFGDQLNGFLATNNEILYRLGIMGKTFIPNTYLSINKRQIKQKELSNYEVADKTIQEMYDLGADGDLSMYFGKLAKDSNYLIESKKVNLVEETGRNFLGQSVKKGTYKYYKIDDNTMEQGGNIPHSNMELLAPNGNKSNLTNEQWHLVRTPQFKAWFGDWEKLAMAKIKDSAMDEVTLANISKDVSKVVDENGEPLVCYHSTSADFNVFNKEWDVGGGEYQIGIHFGTKKQAEDRAKVFGSTRIINAFLKITNLIRIYDQEDWYEDNWSVVFSTLGIHTPRNINHNDVFDIFKKNKLDGFVYKNDWEDKESKSDSFVLFNPSNIKLADGTNTTFDGKNDDIRYEDGGGIEFVPEKKGTLIKGNEIIKYFEKVNGNYRLIFYTLNETKGKVPTMCHSFGYCEELDSENVTPKELVELIKKNNLMETNKMADSNEIQFKEGGNIDESDLLKSYGIGETFSTKEFGLKHNISTALAYKKLSALEDMDLVFKYGYKTRNGWDDVDNSNLKPNSLHWQIPLSNSDMDDEDEIEYKEGGEIESHEEKITYESPDEMFFNLDTSNDLTISKSNASDTAIYEDGGDISTKNSLADIEYYKAKLIEKQDVKSVLTKKIEQDYEELRKLGYEEDTTRRRELTESRNNDRKYSEVIALEIMQYKNIVKCLDKGGSVVSVEDKHGNTINEIPSFIGVSTNLISFIEETILVDESPDYVPTIDEEVFRRKGYVFDAIRVSKNSYMVAFNGYKDIVTQDGVEKRTPTTYEQGYCIVSLDQLVLINDYYFTKARAVLKKEAEDKTKRQENYYDTVPIERRERILNQKNYYYSLPASVKKTITQTDYEALSTIEKEKLYKPYKRYASKRLSSKLEDNQMWISFHEMYQQFVNPEAYPVNKDGILQTGKKVGLGLYGNPEIFKYWYLFRDLMKFKIKDIKMQVDVDNEQYKKARETSFGDINTNDSLVSQYGILVKKQDGKQIGIDLIDQIESGWILISKMLGNLKSVAQADNLKISHTANTNVFASKAIGVYVPQMSTIAVSSKYGEEQFNNTFAHEVGHYVDHHLGKSKGMRYFTDDYEDKAGLIAFKFRSLMNKKSDSDYINSTKECFARAIEQHFAISNYGDNAQMFFTTASKGTIRPYFLDDSYVSKNSYYNILKPMIDEFIDSLEFEYIEENNVVETITENILEPQTEDDEDVLKDLQKYSSPNKYNSEIEVGQRYYDNRYQDYYTIEKMTEVISGGDVNATLKYDKGATRTESGDFILYHIDNKQHSLSKEETKDSDAIINNIENDDINKQTIQTQNKTETMQTEKKQNDWINKVPSSEKYSKKVKSTAYKLDPTDKNLLKIVEPFASKDELRPEMSAILFDENGITCTNAHILIHLEAKNLQYEGLFIGDKNKKLFGDVKADQLNVSAYPKWKNIIRENVEDENLYDVDVLAIKTYCEIVERLKFSNQTIRAIKFSYGNDNEKLISFNYGFMLTLCESLLLLGYEKCKMVVGRNNQYALFVMNENFNLSMNPANESFALIMPIMITNLEDYGNYDIDMDRGAEFVYSLTNDAIYSNKEYFHKINTNITKAEASNSSSLDVKEVAKIKSKIKKANYSIPILDYCKIENGVLTINDLESIYETKASGYEDGIYEILGESLRKVPNTPLDDYPRTPKNVNIKLAEINRQELVYILDLADNFVGTDDLRPIMTGVSLSYKEGQMVIASTDANKLLRYELSSFHAEKDFSLVLPVNYFDFLRFFDCDNITIYSSENSDEKVLFDCDSRRIYFRNIDGRYPAIDSVIPSETNNQIVISKKVLSEMLATKTPKDKEYQIEHNFYEDGTIKTFNVKRSSYNYNDTESDEKTLVAEYKVDSIRLSDESTTLNKSHIFLAMPVMVKHKEGETVSLISFRNDILKSMSKLDQSIYEINFTASNRAGVVPIDVYSVAGIPKTPSQKIKEKEVRKVKPVIVQKPKIEPMQEPISDDKRRVLEAIKTIEEIMGIVDGKDLIKLQKRKSSLEELVDIL